MNKYVVYNSDVHGKVSFYFVGETVSECEVYRQQKMDEYYELKLEKAIKNCLSWLQALYEADDCTWDSYEYIVYWGNHSYGFNTLEDIDLEIENCIRGKYIADWIDRTMPTLKIWKVEDLVFE